MGDEQKCSYYKRGSKPLFGTKESDKCSAIGTTIPDVRVTKYCTGDFFECEIFQTQMGKKEK